MLEEAHDKEKVADFVYGVLVADIMLDEIWRDLGLLEAVRRLRKELEDFLQDVAKENQAGKEIMEIGNPIKKISPNAVKAFLVVGGTPEELIEFAGKGKIALEKEIAKRFDELYKELDSHDREIARRMAIPLLIATTNRLLAFLQMLQANNPDRKIQSKLRRATRMLTELMEALKEASESH